MAAGIATLVGMGFTLDRARSALEAADGDVEIAIRFMIETGPEGAGAAALQTASVSPAALAPAAPATPQIFPEPEPEPEPEHGAATALESPFPVELHLRGKNIDGTGHS